MTLLFKTHWLVTVSLVGCLGLFITQPLHAILIISPTCEQADFQSVASFQKQAKKRRDNAVSRIDGAKSGKHRVREERYLKDLTLRNQLRLAYLTWDRALAEKLLAEFRPQIPYYTQHKYTELFVNAFLAADMVDDQQMILDVDQYFNDNPDQHVYLVRRILFSGTVYSHRGFKYYLRAKSAYIRGDQATYNRMIDEYHYSTSHMQRILRELKPADGYENDMKSEYLAEAAKDRLNVAMLSKMGSPLAAVHRDRKIAADSESASQILYQECTPALRRFSDAIFSIMGSDNPSDKLGNARGEHEAMPYNLLLYLMK